MVLPENYLLFHNDRDIDVKGTIPGQQPETQQKVCRETKKMHPGAAWYPQENQAVFRGGGTETSVIKENRSSSWKISGQTLSPPVQSRLTATAHRARPYHLSRSPRRNQQQEPMVATGHGICNSLVPTLQRPAAAAGAAKTLFPRRSAGSRKYRTCKRSQGATAGRDRNLQVFNPV